MNKETQEYFNLENKMNKLMKEFYESKDCFCDWSVSDRQKDVLLTYQKKKTTVELKYRFDKIFPDILVELIQDINTNNSGWFFECEADRLHYVICIDEKPKYFYDIKFKKFKTWFSEYLTKRTSGKYIISIKGFGITLNVPVPLSDIPTNIYRKVLYESN